MVLPIERDLCVSLIIKIKEESMFTRLTTRPEDLNGDPLFLVFFENQLLMTVDLELPSISTDQIKKITEKSPFFLGKFKNRPVYSVGSDGNISPSKQMSYIPFRELYKEFNASTFAMTNLASQICRWDRDHQFCGKCATPLTIIKGEFGKECPHCHLTHYPTLSPAIIVAVKKGEKILLAQNYKWVESQMFSTLAGFVEPGETIENAVAREVMEEVGIKIKNIQYVASQSWPFPGSLMLGFTADYHSGTLTPDGVEIIEAHWYDQHNLPKVLPNKKAISRFLIESVLGPIED